AKVGRRYGLSPGDLARINRFSYNTELHDGQRIVVYSPTGEAPREVSMGLTPKPLTKLGAKAAAGTGAAAKPGATKAAAKPAGKLATPAPAKPAPRAVVAKVPAPPKK